MKPKEYAIGCWSFYERRTWRHKAPAANSVNGQRCAKSCMCCAALPRVQETACWLHRLASSGAVLDDVTVNKESVNITRTGTRKGPADLAA